MNRLDAYRNSIWLADGERFQPYVARAMAQPCPSAKDIAKIHRRAMKAAVELLPASAQMERLRVYGVKGGSGIDDDNEALIRLAEVSTPIRQGSNSLLDSFADQQNFRAEAPRAIRAVKGKVGVIPIYGPVDQRMTGELEKAGGTPLDFVSAALDALLANASVGAIVLRFDSPGGSVSGLQEVADRIYAARAEKTIIAVADSLAASAALWLASAATMFISTPGANAVTVGSHGVYTMHVDESAALEQEGVKITMVSAGKFKTEGASHKPLGDDTLAYLQERVNGIMDQFTASLAKFREKSASYVRANFGEGRMLTASQALSVGMIDRVMSFSDLLGKLTGSSQQTSNGPSAEKLLLLHEHEEMEV